MDIMKKVADRHGMVCLLHEKPFGSVSGSGKVTLVEETVKTSKGPAKMSYLRLDESCTIPVTLNDYKSSQLIESICN